MIEKGELVKVVTMKDEIDGTRGNLVTWSLQGITIRSEKQEFYFPWSSVEFVTKSLNPK